MRLEQGMQQGRRTLLVTGAAGFLGQQAVEKALAEGWNVVAVVRPRGEDGRAESGTLNALRLKYRDALQIEPVNLEEKTSVDALLERHPEVDSVLHSAAITRPKVGEAAAVQRTNVDATTNLAQACEAMAATNHHPIRFHYVSSVSALYYEQQTEIQHNAAVDAETYSRTKCEASHWLSDHQAALPHLDIRITYPPAIIGPIPSTAWISRVLRMGQAGDPGFEAMQPDKASAITRMVNSVNYLSDVFACLDAPLEQGVHEYIIQPDYQIQMGQLVRLAKQLVAEKKHQTPVHERDVGEQVEMDFSLRELPTPEEAVAAPTHAPITLYDVLSAQYDAIKQQKQRAA